MRPVTAYAWIHNNFGREDGDGAVGGSKVVRHMLSSIFCPAATYRKSRSCITYGIIFFWDVFGGLGLTD